MSAPKYRVHFRGKDHALDALDVEWRSHRLRVLLSRHRVEADEEARVGRRVADGIRAREYPLVGIKYVEDLDPPESP